MARNQRKRITYAQNFLVRPRLIQRIIEHAGVEPGDLVIEIGPGRGTLTRRLASACRQVIAVEKDPTLARRLGAEVGELGNVAVFEGDFLQFPLPVTPYKVVANIPFNVTASIVIGLTHSLNAPESASLLVQREAAERFIGRPKQTLAALLMAPWFEGSIVHQFRQQDFVPPPRVDVVLLRFSKRGPPLVAAGEEQDYRDFVTFGFTAWKPTVEAAFRTVLPSRMLAKLAGAADEDLCRRPSELSFASWLALFRAFQRHAAPEQRRLIAGAEERLNAMQAELEKRHRTSATGQVSPR